LIEHSVGKGSSSGVLAIALPAERAERLSDSPAAAESEAVAQRKPRHRISGLDGLRAISIILVLVSHSRGLNPSPDSFVFRGKFGVYVFFVLSGYLIIRLLLERDLSPDHQVPVAGYVGCGRGSSQFERTELEGVVRAKHYPGLEAQLECFEILRAVIV
jgi:acyltransferase-like protein